MSATVLMNVNIERRKTGHAMRSIERYTYSAYGQMQVRNGSFGTRTNSSFANPYTYTGRRFDTETGLYYYRNRYYDSQLGRFITRDPIGYDGSQSNLYNYVANDPLSNLDPSGLTTIDQMWDGEWGDIGKPKKNCMQKVADCKSQVRQAFVRCNRAKDMDFGDCVARCANKPLWAVGLCETGCSFAKGLARTDCRVGVGLGSILCDAEGLIGL